MSKTAKFRTQHDELLGLATEISSHLNVNELSHDASNIRKLLSMLIGKLGVHLSMEDKGLYPRLLDHPDNKVKETAQRFMDEMGGIGEVLENYKTKWSTSSKIQQSADVFVEETKVLFSALAQRIDAENDELYPLFDAA